MKERLINIGKLLLAVLSFLLISTLVSLILHFIGIDISAFSYNDYGYYDCMIEMILLLIVYLLYNKVFSQDGSKVKNNKNGFISDVLKYFVMFLVVKIISAIVTSAVGFMIGANITESENQDLIVKITKEAPIMMLLSTVVLAPIVEEGLFRLAIRKVIKNKYLFIVISGFLFGLIHIFPTDLAMSVALTYSITYVTMGFYLAFIYVESDNIWVTIGVHALNNLLSMIAILFMF